MSMKSDEGSAYVTDGTSESVGSPMRLRPWLAIASKPAHSARRNSSGRGVPIQRLELIRL